MERGRGGVERGRGGGRGRVFPAFTQAPAAGCDTWPVVVVVVVVLVVVAGERFKVGLRVCACNSFMPRPRTG